MARMSSPMYWPMCSALIDDENVSPSRSTVSTSSHFVTEYVDRPAIDDERVGVDHRAPLARLLPDRVRLAGEEVDLVVERRVARVGALRRLHVCAPSGSTDAVACLPPRYCGPRLPCAAVPDVRTSERTRSPNPRRLALDSAVVAGIALSGSWRSSTTCGTRTSVSRSRTSDRTSRRWCTRPTRPST